MDQTPELSEVEMLEILKDIARSASNQAARIAAIKELRAMARGEQPVEETVRGLYEVSNPGRIRVKAPRAA